MNVAFVIPTLNEEDNLKITLPEIKRIFPGAPIIVVDDFSTDSTVEVAKKYAWVPESEILKRRGLGRSYKEGIVLINCVCNPDAVVIMDADHPVAPISAMLTYLYLDDFDIIIGSEIGSRSRASKVASYIARKVLGIKLSQPTCGLMAIKKNVFTDMIDVKNLKSKGDAFHLELLYRAKKAGARIKEIEFVGIAKEHTSNSSLKRVSKWLYEVLKMRYWG